MFNSKNDAKDKLNSIKFEDEYLWGNILNDYIWAATKNNFIKEFIKSIIKICITKNYDLGQETSIGNGPVLLFYSAEKHREDMKKLLNSTGEFIECKDYMYIYKSNKISFRNLFSIFDINKYYSKLRHKFSVLESIILSLYIIEKKIIEKRFFDNLDLTKYKCLITFCDCFPEDNLITQIFKKNKIKTCTLQHGLYVFCDRDTILSHFYDNFTSDYIFLWGNDTKNVFTKAGIDESRLLVLGNPKYNNIEKSKLYNYRLNRKDCKVFGVIMNNPLGEEENKKIIRLSNEFAKIMNYKYVIKPHPSINMELYKDIIENEYLVEILPKTLNIQNYAKNVDFSIVGLSTVYLELNLFVSPVFRYIDLNSNYNKSNSLNKDYFSKPEELVEICERYMNNKELWLFNMIKYSKEFFFNEDIEKNYKNKINEIIN